MNTREYTLRVKKSWVKYGFVAIVAAMVLAPVAVSASHTFTDVPDTHIFHSDIAWMADNGITSGCTPTEYCPGDSVTRGQMAKFLRNVAENKVVDAATAETAGTADHATTADSATEADNADTLDGKSSGAFHEYDIDVPAFQTLYGAVGTDMSADAVEVMSAPISFPVPMPTDLDAIIVAPGDLTPANCTGDVDDPGADPGYLCIFVDFDNNVDFYGFYRDDGFNDVTSPFGGQVYAWSLGAGYTGFSATWAATAPLTLIPIPLDKDAQLGAGQ
jgi:hypothetical protein